MLRVLSLLVVPLLLLALAGFGAAHLYALPHALHPLLAQAPVALLIVAALLAWRFNSSRSFFTALVLLAAYWVLRSAVGPYGTIRFHRFWLMLCVLAPLTIAGIAWLRERGVLTAAAFSRYLLLAAVGALGGWFVLSAAPALVAGAARPLLHVSLPVHVPQLGLLAALAALALLVWRLLQLRSAIEASLLGVLGAIFMAVNVHLHQAAVISALSCAGLMLLWGVLARSHDMAYRDALTGLPARRALDDRLAALGRRYAIAMLDVDHFKRFNDTYGHDVGDQVLRMVASQMRRVGGGGRAYRYGGEEFAIVFTRRSIEDVRPALEALRLRVADYRMALRGRDRPVRRTGRRRRSGRKGTKEVAVTISIGVAERDRQLREPLQVLKAADQALYRAKRRGRNQVSE